VIVAGPVVVVEVDDPNPVAAPVDELAVVTAARLRVTHIERQAQVLRLDVSFVFGSLTFVAAL
jgi:hypothetical protein